jgi:hypothetical protein
METRTISMSTNGRTSDTSAFTDCYVADRSGTALLISIVGSDSSVKALTGQFFEKVRRSRYSSDGLQVRGTGAGNNYRAYDRLDRDAKQSYTIKSGKLPNSNAIHHLIADRRFFEPAESAPDTYLLFVRPGDCAIKLLWERVYSQIATPMLEHWSQHVTRALIALGSITAWQGYNCAVIKVTVSEKDLDRIISDAVQGGMVSWKA